MSFLYPVLATAALTVLVPILLHLFRRRDLKRIEFPAVRYLRRAEERHAQRLKIRHVLLLVTRVIMVLLLALLAAGLLAGRGGPGDHDPTAVAIVIDNSLSSSRPLEQQTLLDSYIDRVATTLDWFGSRDRLAIFDTGSDEALPFAGDIGAARGYVRSLRPSATLADLGDLLARSAAWLGSHPEMAREIHLFTDLQAVSVSRPPLEAAPVPADSDAAVRPDEVGSPPPGAGIVVVVQTPVVEPEANGSLGPPLPESDPPHSGVPTRIATELTWFGPAPPDDPVVVRLVVDERVVAAAEARVGQSALLTLPPQESGYLQGHVELDGMGMAADDRRYFTWFIRQPPGVALTREPGTFLDHALSTLEDAGRLVRVEPPRADAWIAVNGETPESALSVDHPLVLLPPQDPLELPRLNRRLAAMGIAWRLEPDPEVGASRISEAPAFPVLVGLRVQRAYRLISTGPGDDRGALARLEDGRTWLVGGTARGGQRYLLTASALTPDASDLPVSAAMVPFLDALIADALGSGGGATLNREGTTRVRVPERGRSVVLPDGVMEPVEGGGWFEAREPGNYRFLGRDPAGTLGAFSINAPAAESDLRVARFDDLTALLPKADWSRVEGGSVEDWLESAFASRRGRHIWWPLVVALILASFVEASLAAAGRRGMAGAGGLSQSDGASRGSDHVQES